MTLAQRQLAVCFAVGSISCFAHVSTSVFSALVDSCSAHDDAIEPMAALSADDECFGLAANSQMLPECGLSALQLHGRPGPIAPGGEGVSGALLVETEAQAAEDSGWPRRCSRYGCTASYNPRNRCQCNEACGKHSNCCVDYQEICHPAHDDHHGNSSNSTAEVSDPVGDEAGKNISAANATTTVSELSDPQAQALAESGRYPVPCELIGCGFYSSVDKCPCGGLCARYCCPDFEEVCGSEEKKAEPFDMGEIQEAEGAEAFKIFENGTAETLVAAMAGEDLARAEPTCRKYGCVHYRSWQRCQCNAQCRKFGNCCRDFAERCGAEESTSAEPARPDQPAPAGVRGHPSAQKVYPVHEGFTLRLVEEFDEPIDLDKDDVWTWSDGGLGEGQVRFVKEAIQFANGKMMIEVRKNRHAKVDACSHAEKATLGSKPLTSGEMRTKINAYRYGRYEVRMKAPSVRHGDTRTNGNYISTMFVYRDAKFRHWREIDIEVTGDSPKSVTTNVLNADYTHKWSPAIAESGHIDLEGSNVREEFHTYAFEWLPHSITWFIDGRKIREKRSNHGLPVPNLPGKIMMNLWVFGPSGGFGGRKVHNNEYPMHNEYDWFRFYSWNGDKNYPCDRLSADCLTTDDNYLAGNNPCDNIPQLGLLHGKHVCRAACAP